MIDWKKEQQKFHKEFGSLDSWVGWKKRSELAYDEADALRAEINDLKQQLAEAHKIRASWVEYSQKIESGEFVLVANPNQRKGGYYIRDLRNPIGNCMKFWYQHGYGTKHSKFHWFETLEQAQHRAGGAGWFEIWYAPYIDSIIESTVDIQKAYRSEEKAMVEKMENYHE